MRRLSERHPDNIVLILSDDVEWSTQHLKIVSGHYVASSDPHLDLAILSLCDHTVIDYGTFGVWVGTTDCWFRISPSFLRSKFAISFSCCMDLPLKHLKSFDKWSINHMQISDFVLYCIFLWNYYLSEQSYFKNLLYVEFLRTHIYSSLPRVHSSQEVRWWYQIMQLREWQWRDTAIFSTGQSCLTTISRWCSIIKLNMMSIDIILMHSDQDPEKRMIVLSVDPDDCIKLQQIDALHCTTRDQHNLN